MKVLKWIALGTGILLVILIIAVALLHTPSVQMAIFSRIQEYLENEYGIRIESERLSYKLFPRVEAELKNLRVFGGPENKNQFASTESVRIYAPLSILWSSDRIVEKIQIHKPDVDLDNPPHPKTKVRKEEGGKFEIQAIEITGGSARFQKSEIEELELKSSLGTDELQIQNLRAVARGATLTAKGRIFDFDKLQYDLHYDLQGDASFIQSLATDLPKINGPISANGKIGGYGSKLTVNGSLNSSQLSFEGSSAFSIQSEYEIDRGSIDKPYKIQLQWSDFQVSSLRKYLKETSSIAAFATGTLQYEGGTDPFAARGSVKATLRPGGSGSLPVSGSIQGNLENGTLTLAPSNVVVRSTTAAFSGTVRRNSLDVDVKAKIADTSDVAMFAPDIRKLPGSYQIDARLRGPFDDLTIQGDVVGTARDMNLQVKGTFRTGPMQVQAELKGNFKGSSLRRLNVGDVAGNFQVEGTVDGFVKNPKLEGQLIGKNVAYRGIKIGDTNVDFNSDGRTLNANAKIPSFETELNGSYLWKTSQFIVDASTSDLTTEELGPLLPASVQEVEGTFSGSLHAEGNAKRWKQAEAKVQIDSAKFVYQQVPLEIQPGSVAQMRNGQLQSNIQGKAGTGSFSVNGSYILAQNRYDLTAQVNGIKIEEFRQLNQSASTSPTLQTLQGSISAVIAARGNAKRWKDSEAEIKFQEAFFKKEDLEVRVKSDSTVRLQQRKLIADLDISLPEGEFRIEGTLPIEDSSGADLRAVGNTDLKIASMFTDQVILTGRADIDLRIRGNLKKPEITGDFRSQNFTAQYPARKITFRGDFASGHFSGQDIELNVKGAINDANITVQGVVPVTSARSGNIKLDVQDFPLNSLAPESQLIGEASLALQAQGTGIKPENWNAQVELTFQDVQVGDTKIESEAIKVSLNQQRLTLQPFQIKAANTLNLSVSGSADLQSQQLQADVKTQMDLIFLRNVIPDFIGSGNLKAEVQARGSIKDPQMSGLITLDDGFVRVPDYPMVVEQINLRVPFDRNRATIEKLTARLGGGTIEGSGQFDLKNFKPVGANVNLIAKNVRVNYPEDLRSQLNANLKITSEDDDFLLGGDVDIVRSIYTEDIDYRDRLMNSLLSQRRALASTGDMPSRLRLNLNVKTVEDFRMRNNLARIRALANLQVQGNVSQPRILGRVQIRDGSVLFFRGNEFVFEEGNVDFYGTRKINPTFDFQLFALVDNSTPPDPGDFTVDQYEVEISVRGTLDDLEDTTVQSFPPLDEQAIYSLLLTGGTDSSLSQAGSALFQEELASYFAGQLFFGAPQELGKALGLNRVEIQPDLISPEEDPSAKLVVGKDITSHLGLIYSVSLSDSEDQTWIVNYRLMRNFSLRFVDQSEEGYTLGLRHSLRFGPGAASLRSRKLSKRRDREVIEKVEIKNDSKIPDQEIFKKVDELQGRAYDYWEVNDQLTDLKLFLQERGYLFPEVSFEETRPQEGKVHLSVEVADRGQRSMAFVGYQPSKKRIKKYEEWWREGFSEQAILEQIHDDLLKELWQEGHLRAQVEIESDIKNGSGRYVFKITPNTKFLKIALKFSGANHYGEKNLFDELKKLYGSEKPVYVDAFHRFRNLENRIKALYVQKGFLDVGVKEGVIQFRNDGSAEREIFVNENQPARIADLEISNGQTFPPDLLSKLKAGPGKPYNPKAVGEDLITVTEYYETRGYLNVEVDSEIMKQRGKPDLILRYNLKTGVQARIGSIRIIGNSSTRRSVIEKRLTFREGELLVRSKLLESQRNLYRSRNFQLVKIEAQEGERAALYVVTVDLTESRKYRATYGISYDTEKDLEGQVILQDTRLFGMGQNISYFARVNSLEQNYGVTYSIPSIHKGLIRGLDWDTLFTARYEREEHEGFLERNIVLSAQKQFRLVGPFVTLGEYRYERNRITENIQIGPILFDTKSNISQVIGTVLADNRDDPLNAKKGYLISLENGFAPSFLQGDEIFKRFYYQFFYFKPIGKMIWASGVRTGFAFPDAERLIISERFFAGGSSTIRGFELDSVGPRDPIGPLGGEGVFILNQEIRFPIYKWFGGTAFYDGGNVWVKAGDMSLGDLRHTVGLGLRVETPFGVGRFDWGINLDPQSGEQKNVFHFGLGQAF